MCKSSNVLNEFKLFPREPAMFNTMFQLLVQAFRIARKSESHILGDSQSPVTSLQGVGRLSIEKKKNWLKFRVKLL